jgi:Eukaryotic aspartyl protease
MLNQGLLDEPVFSFRLGPSEDDGGEAIFGGIDHSAYTGKINYVPVKRKAYWEVPLGKVAYGDDILELENTGAAIDTGVSRYLSEFVQPPKCYLFRHLFDCSTYGCCRDAERTNWC